MRPSPSPVPVSPLVAHHALEQAVLASDEGAVRDALAQGGDPNRSTTVENPPGHVASYSLLQVAWDLVPEDRGGDRIMAMLLDAGADPWGCPDDVWDRVVIDRIETVFEAFVRRGAGGRWSSTYRRHPMVQLFDEIQAPILDGWITLMLEHGLRVDQWVQGRSVLGWAAHHGDAHLARRLVHQGADPDRVDDQGRTMLDLVHAGRSRRDSDAQQQGRRDLETLWVEHQRRALQHTLSHSPDAGPVRTRARPRI